VEEMPELTKALCKYKECQRKYDNPLNRKPQEVYSNIEEEIADVFIMLVQLLAFFRGRESVSITKIVWDKLDRLKDNLDKEAAKQEGCKDDTPEC
jgi:NTP pyrophosphatase (non-canonical NTP hydrolase)